MILVAFPGVSYPRVCLHLRENQQYRYFLGRAMRVDFDPYATIDGQCTEHLFQDFPWGAVENKPGFKFVARLSSHGSLDLFLDKFRQDFYESIHSFLSKDWLLEGNGGSKSIPLSASGLSSTSPSIRSCWPRSFLAMSCLSMTTP